jgi:hypothetical protein
VPVPIIHDGAAQMIIAGPETIPGYSAIWLLHNNDTANAVYLDVNQNIQAIAGSTNFIIPPGATIALTGTQTYWARTADGTTADLHVVPTSTYGAPGATATTAAGAAFPFSAG